MSVRRDINRERRNDFFESLSFPANPGEHNIVFFFKDYNYKTINRGSLIKTVSRSTLRKSVVLPLPNNLVDSYNVNINSEQLGILGGITLDAATAIQNDSFSNITNALFQVSEGTGERNSTIISDSARAISFLRKNALSSFPGGIGTAVDQIRGTTTNPHTSLVFEGMNLKEHNFSWNVSPRNENEARRLKEIIRYIKSKILPEYDIPSANQTDSTAIERSLLRYPSLVDISFIGLDQSYFYFFKTGMITNFSVNYSPDRIVLNKGGKPSILKISMTIQESKSHLANNYKDSL